MQWRRFIGAALIVVFGLIGLFAAVSAPRVAHGPPQLSVATASAQRATSYGACIYNADCNAPLTCVSGQCVEQCVNDWDCNVGWGVGDSECRSEVWTAKGFEYRRPVGAASSELGPGEVSHKLCVDRRTRLVLHQGPFRAARDPINQGRCGPENACAEPLRCVQEYATIAGQHVLAGSYCHEQCRRDAECGDGASCRFERWTVFRDDGHSPKFLEVLPRGTPAPARYDADGTDAAAWGVCYSNATGRPLWPAGGRPAPLATIARAPDSAVTVTPPPMIAVPVAPNLPERTPPEQPQTNGQTFGATPVSGPYEFGVDRPGNDVDRVELKNDDPATCAALCSQRGPSCEAWTLVHAGVQGPVAICYLKAPAPEGRPDRCCVSGLRR